MGWMTEYKATGIVREWVDVADNQLEHDECKEDCIEHEVVVEFRTYEEHNSLESPGDYEELDESLTIDGKELNPELTELPHWLTTEIIADIKQYGRSGKYYHN